MARKKKAKGPSVRSYFREAFTQNPDWLNLSENTLVLEKWKADHPGEELTENIKQSMGSCKSAMRVELGIARPSTKPAGRKPKASAAAVPAKSAVPDLEQLETRIYDCFVDARSLGVEKLEPVVKHLRKALAHIVLAFDDPS